MYKIININDYSKTEYERFYNLMTDKKRARIDRFRFEDDKKRSVFGEMLAKQMLSERFNIAPESIVIMPDENGKPYADGLNVHFNISHSGELVICAVSDKPIGVDIEEIKNIKDTLIDYVCTADEKEYVSGNKERFFEIWTAKEAYFKCTGTGITDVKSVNTLDNEFRKHINSFNYKNYFVCIYSNSGLLENQSILK